MQRVKTCNILICPLLKKFGWNALLVNFVFPSVLLDCLHSIVLGTLAHPYGKSYGSSSDLQFNLSSGV